MRPRSSSSTDEERRGLIRSPTLASTAGVAVVDIFGTATGVSPGVATITAFDPTSGFSGSMTLTVVP